MKKFERIKDYILPYILTLLLCTSIFGIFDNRFFTFYNLVSALIILAMFMFFGFMKKHRIAGTFIYIAAAIAALYLMIRFIYAGDWGNGFSKWFLSAGEDEKFRRRYFYALLSAFPFFFSTVVYYFCVMLYRTSFLMLVSLVPCAVYVKVLADMSDTYLVCIAGLNAAIYVVNSRKKKTSEGTQYGEKAHLLSAAVIVSASLLASSLLPKQGEAKYYYKFEKYFMDAGQANGEDFSNLRRHSSDAGLFRQYSYTPLYDVYAPDLLYFRRQCFDMYDRENHYFYPLEKYSRTAYRNADESIGRRKAVNLDDMLSAMKYGLELGCSAGINKNIISLDETGEIVSEANVIPDYKHNAGYLISSLRTFSIDSSLAESAYGFTMHGQAVSGKKLIDSSKGSFSFEYYPEHSSQKIWIENGGADFTDESYREYLYELKNILSENGKEQYYNTADAFENEFHYAMEYKTDCSGNNSEIPEDIAELAAEITDGYEYDYQKAEAIQAYFLSGEYTYDYEYIPPKGMNTASYFVFTSKRGTCSDFAAAYTLMARSAGLTVRYTEGFSPSFKSGGNYYKIFEKDAHAYPEVYIHNTGWMVFDPTAVSDGGNFNIGTPVNPPDTGISFNIDTGRLLSVIKLICAALAVSAVIIIAVPSVSKLYDNIRIRKSGAKGVILAYRRLRASAGICLQINTKACTPHELYEIIYSRTGIDLSDFMEIYENVCFGGITPDKEQNEYIYIAFRNTVKKLRKLRLFK